MGKVKKIVDGVVVEVDDNTMVKVIENGVVVEKPLSETQLASTEKKNPVEPTVSTNGSQDLQATQELPSTKTLDNIYQKYSALRGLGDVTLKEDPNFTRDKTGAGSIEYFSPEQDNIRYGTGLNTPHPKKGTHGIVYNPNDNTEEDIMLDMLHGMNTVPEYAKLRDAFKKQTLKDRREDINFFYEKDKKEGNAPDGKEAWVNNYVDGLIRSEISTATEGDYALEREGNSPTMKSIASEIDSYLKTGSPRLEKKPTQAAPLEGLGGVSEQATASPSVGQGVLKDVDQTQTTDGELDAVKKSIDRPLMAAQDRAKQESQSGSSLNLSRTEKFVPYDISEPEITIDEEAEGYIPDEFGAYSTSYEETEKDKSLLAQSEVKKQAQKRALKHEIARDQLLSVDVKDKLFDKDYTDSLLDTYAPRGKEGLVGGPGGAQRTVGIRDQEKVDEYQVALNAAKQQVVSEKLSNIMDSGDTAFQSAELNIDKAMNSWLETAKDLETKEGRKDLTFIEDLILDDEYIKKGADISTVHDILQPGYVGGAQGIFDSEIDKFVEENLEDLSIESDEEKKMMKVHLKEVYKSKKKIDKAAGEVAKKLGFDADDVTKDFDKIGEKITGY